MRAKIKNSGTERGERVPDPARTVWNSASRGDSAAPIHDRRGQGDGGRDGFPDVTQAAQMSERSRIWRT